MYYQVPPALVFILPPRGRLQTSPNIPGIRPLQHCLVVVMDVVKCVGIYQDKDTVQWRICYQGNYVFLNFFFNAVTSDETEWECVLRLQLYCLALCWTSGFSHLGL